MAKGIVLREHRIKPEDSPAKANPVTEKVIRSETFRCPFCLQIMPIVMGMGRIFEMKRDGQTTLGCRSCVTHHQHALKRGGVQIQEL